MKWRGLSVVLLLAFPLNAQQFTVTLTGGKSVTNWHGQADVTSVDLEWSRPRWGHTDIGFLIEPSVLWQPRSWFGDQYHDGNERVRAIGSALMARHHFGLRGVLYAEMSIGPMWAEKQVPAATSRFNFVTRSGFGITIRRHSHAPMMFGVRFAHISNGGYAGRNPGLNVSALVLGVQFRK